VSGLRILNFNGIGQPHAGVPDDELPYWVNADVFAASSTGSPTRRCATSWSPPAAGRSIRWRSPSAPTIAG